MRRLAFTAAILLSSCGYDGSYRYPCQDPENWGSDDCEPPACLSDNACTETLLGFDPFELTTTTTTEPPIEETE